MQQPTNRHQKSYDLLDLQQGSQEWLEVRKDKIGASDAPVIMCVSPWKTPFQLWESKVKGGGQNVTTQAMQRGISMEPEIRRAHESATGKRFLPVVAQSIEYPWMIASLDGLSEDMTSAIEIKCAGKNDHDHAKSGLVPDHYLPQLQHQMFVCGLDSITYVSCSHNDINDIVSIRVVRDDEYIEEMLRAEECFYSCLKNKKAPEYLDADFIEHVDTDWLVCANEWRRLKGLLSIYEQQEKSMRALLIKKSEGHNCKGGGVRLSHLVRKGVVKYDRIPELHGVDLEQYRGDSTDYWKIEEI